MDGRLMEGNLMRRLAIPGVAIVFLAVFSMTGSATRTSATSTPQSTPTSASATNWDPSGQAMPVGDISGWHQVFADNFANDSYPLGSFTGCTQKGCSGRPSMPWGAVPDGNPDTSGHCVYQPSKTVSVTGGVMNIFLHTDPNGTCMDASLYPLAPDLRYGMYSVRFRADAVTGYKGVFLLWPEDHVHGEIDFPEANLDSQLHGFLHTIAGGAQFQSFASNASWTSWHTATLEWTPSKVTFILDGRSVGSTSLDVPQTPMTLALRGESELQGAPKPPASAHGNLQIDWATMYTYAPKAAQPPAVAVGHGYDLVGSDGGVFSFGGAFHGSLPGVGVHVDDIAGIVSTTSDTGYFLVGADGGVFAFNAPFANSLPGVGVHVNDIVNLVPTLNDSGYFLVGRDGGVFSFNAPFLGSLPGIGVHVDDIVGIAATADDGGYWLVGSDGSVYAFGDAHFFGAAPAGAVSITATRDGGGYWVVGSDGSVTPFGDASGFGDLPSLGIDVGNIVGMIASPDGQGYNVVGRDGGIFSFGDATNLGSLPGVGVVINDIVGAVRS
jgi:hypothetical protein